MSTFLDDIESDADEILFSDFVRSATYNGVAVDVIETTSTYANTNVPGFSIPLYTIAVKLSDVQSPKAGDSVVYRGKTCTVGEGPRSEGGVWFVELFRNAMQVS